MKLPGIYRALLLGLLLAGTSCSHYSEVREKPLGYDSPTPAGQLIAAALKNPSPKALVRMGCLLDAAAAAAAVLEQQPADAQARLDYNFAVGRIFEVIHLEKLEPWKAPLRCPGAAREWRFSIKPDPQPERNPSNFSIQPADRYLFKGTLVAQRTLKEGLGAPLVVMSRNIDPEKPDVFSQGKQIFYGMTGMVDIRGSSCTASFLDPLDRETVRLGSHTYPLAADFTAPLALALADQKPRQKELDGLFRPEEFASQTRLARLQPYDPDKIPVLCIHGLGDSQATWAPLLQTLRGDPVIRQKYQFWFFSYPTAYPYPLAASVLRQRLDDVKGFDPGHRKLVVIGHSMGGMISRLLITDSGMKLWNAIYDQPPGAMPFSAETRKVMTESLIFRHRPEVGRVIFASASHRGSDVASSFWGRLGSRIIGGPGDIVKRDPEVLTMAKFDPTGANLKRMPNSIDFLEPENRFVTTLAKVPVVKGVPYHSIIGDRGKGGHQGREKPVSHDGLVPYWSSHLEGADSEIIIPSHHWTNQHPMGIAEVRRILYLHLGKKVPEAQDGSK